MVVVISGSELNRAESLTPGEDGADNEHLSRPYRIGSHQHLRKSCSISTKAGV